MNEWLLYERKRNAFEKKWKPRIQRVLNNQLQQYVTAYRRGESTAEAFGSEALTKLLFDLYADVGGYWGRSTYKDLRTETRGRRTPARVGSMAGGKALATQGVQVKRFGALGFSIDWANRIISRLRMAGLNLAQYISETTRSKVLDILEDAQKQILDEQGNVIRGNLTLDQIVDKITTEVQEINRNRAEMIARTEVGRASSEGKMQGAKALGVELEKIWISARDNRTRFNPKKDPRKGDHWVLNGQRQPLDEPFDNGVHKLMQPGDPSAPPAETIRCRCTVVFEVKKDVAGKPIAASTVPVVRPASVRTINLEETVRQGFRPAATVKEAKQYIQNLFKDNYNFNVQNVTVNKSMSLDRLNSTNEHLTNLVNEYNVDKALSTGPPVSVIFNSGTKFEGVVRIARGQGRHWIESMNFGHQSSRRPEDFTQNVGTFNQAMFSRVDAHRQRLATATHEFAHVITNSNYSVYGGNSAAFWRELRSVKKEYAEELVAAKRANDVGRYQEILVSKYGNTNDDEFLAEAFTEYKLTMQPSKYAKKVGRLIDKYFKK